MTFHRVLQAFMLVLFLVLLYLAAFPLVSPLPVDLFLRMDPLILVGTIISARSLVPALLLAAFLLVTTFFLGRFFCSYLCPMGTTIDMADRVVRRGITGGSPLPSSLRTLKYLVLFFVLGAALLGVSLVFLVSPLSLITRFYAVVIFPVAALIADTGLNALRGAADIFGLTILPAAAIEAPRYVLVWFVVAVFAVVFGCAAISPRFWCRYLCPAGALFALCSRRPVVRRVVDDRCILCGLCRQQCPMDAICEDPMKTRFGECIACEECVRVCPVDAVRFTYPVHDQGDGETLFSGRRRQLVWSGLFGIGAALVSLAGLHRVQGQTILGQIIPPSLIRPPGALPEQDFLARCMRCGECMKACPTNTLQPIGLITGFPALASPVITPRRGPCEPLCNVCGQVCPTGALRDLSPGEKIWAKVGTAYVIRHKCLAWEFDSECLICDEVCPFDAVTLKRVPEIGVVVPFVDEKKCNGCGFCEYQCPVQGQSAIVVEPMDALRLEAGSYKQQATELGFSFEMKQKADFEPGQGDAGFEDTLPPGFTE